jgi:uncharacterized repeat protein (TIGR01451 family)
MVSAIALLAFCAIVAASFARLGFAQVDGQSQKPFARGASRGLRRDSESGTDSKSAAANDSPDRDKRYRAGSVPGEIIVRFRTEAPPAAKGNSQVDLAVVGRAEIPVDFQRFAGPELVRGLRLARVAPEETERAIEALRARPDVLYAEPNYIRYATKIPNDPRYPEMWGLKNTGQSSTWGGNPGVAGNDIRAEPAWDVTTGSKNVVVGIIDEGIDLNHEDLSGNIWTNPGEIPNNGIDDDANGYVDDVNGWDFAHNDNTIFDYTETTYPPSDDYSGDIDDHGTHVAGTIGAKGDNGKGVAGVNWQVSLLSLKFLTGPEGEGTSADMLKAFAYAKTMRELWSSSGGVRGANIRVLNNSYGGGGFSQAELEAVRALGDAGILFVVAAGNEGHDNDRMPIYPSSYIATNLISVAASTGRGYRANFSNFGSATVHMTAPGEHILSTTPRNTYDFFSGTSMATPHVAGGAALICAAFPNISLSKLRSLVLYSGDVAPWQQYQSVYPISTGRTLNVQSSLQAVNSSDTTSPDAVSQLRIYNSSFPRFGLAFGAAGDDANSGKVAAYQVRFSDTELNDPAQFEVATPLPGPVPEVAGQGQLLELQVPWRHASGFIGIRAIDEAGNAGPVSSIPLTIDAGVGDPYMVTESEPASLTTGGTPIGLNADDEAKSVYLPFGFKFYGGTANTVWVSSNGALYFGFAPESGGVPEDFTSAVNLLNGYQAIAGAWDDLRTDRRAGDDIYVVSPNPDRVIFRWQAVTYDTPMAPGVTRGENPVNFEIELQINGTIILRYGDGNQKLLPLVGLGGGWPDPYVINSHTSAETLKDLTNAGTVSFTLRNPPPPPAADLTVSMNSGPNPVASGSEESYAITVRNYGPAHAPNTTVTDTLPAGLTFVSCTSSQGTCAGPAIGSSGTVTVNVGQLDVDRQVNISLVLRVIAGSGEISNTVSVSSARNDGWGANNSATATAQVVQFPTFGNVSQISSSYFMNLVLKQDGTVWAWGQNDSGALGNGYQGQPIQQNRPIPVGNLSGITAVSSGGPHCLALKSDGTVWAWGSNNAGESGGSGFMSQTPAMASGLNNIVAVSAGRTHSLALGNDGRVWAWGTNSQGELGLGTADNNPHPAPIVVPGLSEVAAIVAGSSFNVVVAKDGTVWSWGNNQNGQLGVPGPSSKSPTRVSGVNDVKAVAVGSNHVLALKTDGTVMGWGLNTSGQTGSTNFGNVNPTPAMVNGLTDVKAVAAGDTFSLALKSDGTIWAWGLNSESQLGNGANGSNPQPTPSLVNDITSAASISAGSSHGLALLDDGTLRSWGSNYYGQLGNGTNLARNTPVQVTAVLLVSQPVFSPGNNWVGPSPLSITLSSTTPGATVRYTLNGQDPTEVDPAIESNSSITIRESLTLKARAFKAGWLPSSVSTATYQVQAKWLDISLINAQITLKAWTVGGRTFVYVMPKFPEAGYRVNNWGQTLRDGNDFSVNALPEWYTGASTPAVKTTAQIYDLGPLAPGNYNFIFKNWGAAVKTLAFTVSANPPDPNAIDDQRQFVRQQYLDFLHREPDAPGWDHWTGEITQCTTDPSKRLPGESEAECIVRKRANTSAAFFLSPEFQNTGYFVLRVYRGSLGRMPYFGGSVPADNAKDEFTRDHGAVSAGIVVNNQLDQTVMYANKQAFVNQFVTRADFQSVYGSLDDEHYVDKLFQTTAITPTASERQALINGLGTGNETRASVLFKIVDGRIEDGGLVVQTRYGQLFYDQQLNPGFVQMEYFGYMKRDPDDAGYAFWLAKLNQYGGNFVDAQMVLAFISSPEYRARFGQP